MEAPPRSSDGRKPVFIVAPIIMAVGFIDDVPEFMSIIIMSMPMFPPMPPPPMPPIIIMRSSGEIPPEDSEEPNPKMSFSEIPDVSEESGLEYVGA